MFDHLRRCCARPTVDADHLKNQAADVGALLSDASARAAEAAGVFAHQTKDAAIHAKDWATPRIEKALVEGKKAAGPKVEAAAEKAIPIVEHTHDRLVDDVLPKLIAAVNAAAELAAVGADKARDVASARLADIAHVPDPGKKRRPGARIFWSIAGLAISGAALAAFRRNRPTTDPWADEPWDDEAWEHSDVDADQSPVEAPETTEADIEAMVDTLEADVAPDADSTSDAYAPTEEPASPTKRVTKRRAKPASGDDPTEA